MLYNINRRMRNITKKFKVKNVRKKNKTVFEVKKGDLGIKLGSRACDGRCFMLALYRKNKTRVKHTSPNLLL